MNSFWSVATAVKDSLKQQAADITSSLRETDWNAELEAFQEGLKEDTVDLGKAAKEVTGELSQKTMEAAKALPSVVDQGRKKAVAQLEQLPSSSMHRAKEAAASLHQAGASLTEIGQRAILSTSEMLDTLTLSIQQEMQAERKAFLSSKQGGGGTSGRDALKFSRFDADVTAVQRDSSTYCDEPADAEDFAAWAETFDLPAHKPDITLLLSENTFMSELQARIVPVVVDYELFWTRYFYRLHKLEEHHAKVEALTSRAEAGVDEAEVGWDMDDEEEEEAEEEKAGVEEAEEDEGEAGVDGASEADVEEEGEQVAAAAVVEEESLVAKEDDVDDDDFSDALEGGNTDPAGSEAKGGVVAFDVAVEEELEAAAAAAQGEESSSTAPPAKEKEKEKKKAAAGNEVKREGEQKAAVDDDELSSLELGDDGGDAGGDEDSDWGDVAEWE